MRLLILLGAGLFFVGSADAALIFLSSNGQGSVDLAPGESVEIKLVVTIRAIDPGFSACWLFLNDDDDSADGETCVTGVAPDGDPDENGLVYERGGFTLPADISWDNSNEYGLFVGTFDGGNWPAAGGNGVEATVAIDTIRVTHTGTATEGTIPLTFEMGSRLPLVYSEGFVSYVWGLDFDGVIPSFIDPGVGGEGNPFIINLVPGPTCEGDANGDGTVDPLDSGFVLARLGCDVGGGDPDCDAADQNGDGSVDPLDSGFVLARFGTCD